eukprot:TRINITY_DN2171_c0_g1_i1.p1 TRINITY_DN2171_c0_g1~~TRINITY_DN2171_c0_g1_i1.p1  ORF type:complete len:1060 (+),score=245.24 TRINITY_DN2171_c0_g1_i1:76-3255(+)
MAREPQAAMTCSETAGRSSRTDTSPRPAHDGTKTVCERALDRYNSLGLGVCDMGRPVCRSQVSPSLPLPKAKDRVDAGARSGDMIGLSGMSMLAIAGVPSPTRGGKHRKSLDAVPGECSPSVLQTRNRRASTGTMPCFGSEGASPATESSGPTPSSRLTPSPRCPSASPSPRPTKSVPGGIAYSPSSLTSRQLAFSKDLLNASTSTGSSWDASRCGASSRFEASAAAGGLRSTDKGALGSHLQDRESMQFSADKAYSSYPKSMGHHPSAPGPSSEGRVGAAPSMNLVDVIRRRQSEAERGSQQGGVIGMSTAASSSASFRTARASFGGFSSTFSRSPGDPGTPERACKASDPKAPATPPTARSLPNSPAPRTPEEVAPEKAAALRERVAMLEEQLAQHGGLPLKVAHGGSPPKLKTSKAETDGEPHTEEPDEVPESASTARQQEGGSSSLECGHGERSLGQGNGGTVHGQGNDDSDGGGAGKSACSDTSTTNSCSKANRHSSGSNSSNSSNSSNTTQSVQDGEDQSPKTISTSAALPAASDPSRSTAPPVEASPPPAEASPGGSPAPSTPGKGKGKGKGKTPPPPPKAATPNGPNASPPSAKGKGKGAPPKAPPRGGPFKAGKIEGPVPRKAEVKPQVPMKKLFWNSFVLDPEKVEQRRSNVWLAIEEDGLGSFDVEELELLFAEAQPGRALPSMDGAEGSSKGRRSQQRTRVFEESRRRQVCVMLARLPSVDTAVAAVGDMNDACLDKDQVELLLGTAPQQEEITMLRSTAEAMQEQGLPIQWDVAEDFVLKLSKVPSYMLRLQVWSFENCFEERFEIFHSAVIDVKDACHALRDSCRVQKLLGLALSVGNYLNAGTSRGRADGFSVEVLTQMRTLKGQAQGGRAASSLLDFLVRQAEQNRPGDLDGLFGEAGEATLVHRAMRHKLGDLMQELTVYNTQAQGLAKRANASEDEVLSIRAQRVEARLSELASVQELFKEAETDYNKLCAWFHEGGDKKPRPADEFFGHWDSFFQAVRAALEALYGGRTRRRKAPRSKPLRPLEQVKKSLTLNETVGDED